VRLHPSTMTTERWSCNYLAIMLNLFTVEQSQVSERSECSDAGGKIPYLWIVWQWVFIILQVLPYINGFNHVAKIAAEADVENNLVKACVQNLVW